MKEEREEVCEEMSSSAWTKIDSLLSHQKKDASYKTGLTSDFLAWCRPPDQLITTSFMLQFSLIAPAMDAPAYFCVNHVISGQLRVQISLGQLGCLGPLVKHQEN